jgi:hypothetical protein
MSPLKTIIILATFALASVLGSCDNTPQISGPQSFVIGQQITIDLTKGEELIENDFTLIDADDKEYLFDNPDIEYVYIGKNNFSFRIPAGAADGEATLKIGSKGDTYSLTITIYRGIVYSDGSGLLKLSGINSPATVLKSAPITQEKAIIKLVDNHSSIIVLSPESGQLDWFLVDSKDSSKFVLKIPSFKIETSTQGINANPNDVVATDPFLILATDVGVGIVKAQSFGVGSDISFENWVSQDADFKSVSKSEIDSNELFTYAAVGGTDINSSIMIWFKSDALLQPTPAYNMVTLSSDAATVSDVTVSQNGRFAAAVIPSESKLYLVEISQSNPVPVATVIENCNNPTALEFVNNSERVVVLCEGSNSVQMFNVSGTTANPFQTLSVGSNENPPTNIFHSADGKLYISIKNGGLYVFDATSSNPSIEEIPNSSSLNADSFIIQP